MAREDVADQFATKAPEPETPKVRQPIRASYLGDDLAARVDGLAEDLESTPSKVIRWLVKYGLDAVDSGELKPKAAIKLE